MKWCLVGLISLIIHICVSQEDLCADQHCHNLKYENMHAGLVGYDPVLSDPFDFKKDPGKHQSLCL